MDLPPPSKKLIFILDDDRDIGQVLRIVIEDAGFEVQLFDEPLAAIEALRTAPRVPQLLITDFHMPVMNGMEVIAEARKIAPGLKTISVSGTLTNSALRAYAVHPDAVLAKPFHPAELLLEMSKLLGLPPITWPEN